MSQLNLIQRANLYRLKRDYGTPLDIYKLLSADTDTQTGVCTVSVEVVHVDRAVKLPSKQSRRDAARATAKKSGLYDVNVCDFIIDYNDAGNLSTLTDDDWIVAKGCKYQVSLVETCEANHGWIVTGRELVGEVPQQVIVVRAGSSVGVTTNG